VGQHANRVRPENAVEAWGSTSLLMSWFFSWEVVWWTSRCSIQLYLPYETKTWRGWPKRSSGTVTLFFWFTLLKDSWTSQETCLPKKPIGKPARTHGQESCFTGEQVPGWERACRKMLMDFCC
jgi:hypothetical protein